MSNTAIANLVRELEENNPVKQLSNDDQIRHWRSHYISAMANWTIAIDDRDKVRSQLTQAETRIKNLEEAIAEVLFEFGDDYEGRFARLKELINY